MLRAPPAGRARGVENITEWLKHQLYFLTCESERAEQRPILCQAGSGARLLTSEKHLDKFRMNRKDFRYSKFYKDRRQKEKLCGPKLKQKIWS